MPCRSTTAAGRRPRSPAEPRRPRPGPSRPAPGPASPRRLLGGGPGREEPAAGAMSAQRSESDWQGLVSEVSRPGRAGGQAGSPPDARREPCPGLRAGGGPWGRDPQRVC